MMTGETEVLGEKTVTLPLFSTQISHEMGWIRARASAVKGRRLIAWAIERLKLTRIISKYSARTAQ
jgi:hypothetical protein